MSRKISKKKSTKNQNPKAANWNTPGTTQMVMDPLNQIKPQLTTLEETRLVQKHIDSIGDFLLDLVVNCQAMQHVCIVDGHLSLKKDNELVSTDKVLINISSIDIKPGFTSAKWNEIEARIRGRVRKGVLK